MDWSNIVIYIVVALVLMFVLPKLGLRGGRGGGSPFNPPGGGGSRGGGLFPPSSPGQPSEPDAPAPRSAKERTSGDFADRIEGERPEKST